MKTGLSKKQKTTNIYFTEADDLVEVCTYNTALKNRLYVPADFDTIEKAFSGVKTAKKGIK